MSQRYFDHYQADLASAAVVIVPMPYDGTVSYIKGTQKGPAAIVEAAGQLEDFEEELGWEPTKELKIHSLAPIEAQQDERPEAYLGRVRQALTDVPATAFLLGLGGEHTVSIPLVEKCLRPGDLVISIDAHPDLRDEYEGERYSHACVMKRLVDAGMSLVEIGLGCISRPEAKWVETQPRIRQFWAKDLATPENFNGMLSYLAGLGGNVYLSLDADGLCTSIMPGVGTPMPGGLSWSAFMQILRTLSANPGIVLKGFDIVEVKPLADTPLSEFTAAKIIQKVLSYTFRRQ
jgi:agmatinase